MTLKGRRLSRLDFLKIAAAGGAGVAAAVGATSRSAYAQKGGKAKLDPVRIICASASERTITLRICAGPSGAPAGFSVQWRPRGGADDDCKSWPVDSACLCKASFSGVPGCSAYNLGSNACVEVQIGALDPSECGVSVGDPSCEVQPVCGLVCDTAYCFRAFAHNVPGGANRSDYSYGDCRTAPCDFDEPPPCCSLTQGAYGSEGGAGSVPASSFPLVVGIGKTITLTSNTALLNYLPAGGSPGQLSVSYTDPTSTSAGVFGGQVTALKLNVLLNNCLGPIYLCDSTSRFHGMTIAQILAEMERVLGGGTLLAGTSLGLANNNGYNYVATKLNESFDNCVTSDWAMSFLRSNCPGA